MITKLFEIGFRYICHVLSHSVMLEEFGIDGVKYKKRAANSLLLNFVSNANWDAEYLSVLL